MDGIKTGLLRRDLLNVQVVAIIRLPNCRRARGGIDPVRQPSPFWKAFFGTVMVRERQSDLLEAILALGAAGGFAQLAPREVVKR